VTGDSMPDAEDDRSSTPAASPQADPDPWRLDQACRETARRIAGAHPRWLIIWGPYSRRYWAHPCLPVPAGTLVHASDPGTLVAGIRAVELAVRQDGNAGWRY
jgi:hypothetical protein